MSAPRPSIAERRRTFRRMHETGCFIIPNPANPGEARYLQSLGFKAVATTSSGFAWSRACPDNGITRGMALAHLREMVEATDLPVNADFEGGFATEPAGVAESVRLAVETGVAALSIEDSTGDSAHPLYDLPLAVERMRAARRAIDAAGGDTLLVGRAECFLVGRPNLEETIGRLEAYSDAGADCLYAPGIRTREDIAAVVKAVAPKPVNLLIGWASELTLADVAALGVRRISVGGALSRAAWGGFIRAAKLMVEEGRFDGLANAASGADLNGLFGRS
jgi:2-methylisocitrate lyase-like PEP mutase family enzyme